MSRAGWKNLQRPLQFALKAVDRAIKPDKTDCSRRIGIIKNICEILSSPVMTGFSDLALTQNNQHKPFFDLNLHKEPHHAQS